MPRCIHVLSLNIAFTTFSGDAFGKDVRIELTLLDILSCQTKMEGIKLEIADSGFELVDKVVVSINAEEAFIGTEVAILLG